MNVIGLDIGGANLKAAESDGRCAVRAFPVWKSPERLSAELGRLLNAFGEFEMLAITMTAELADCFATKHEGVDFILKSVEAVAGGRPVVVWQTGAEFVSPDVARDIPLLVAAANWHALATWVGRMAPDDGAVLIDIGTTTSDIIPLQRGVPVPIGLTDRERLIAGELTYTGVRRTPVCAVAESVPLRDGRCPLAAELFATMFDVYLLLEQIAEDEADCDTANGRPATIAAAHDRLARMVCCDHQELGRDEVLAMARFLAEEQCRRLADALERVLQRLAVPCRHVLLSGAGRFVAERLVRQHPRLAGAAVMRLAEILDPLAAEAACALAVARLADERVSRFH